MAGYENLSPNQIMQIVYLATYCLTIYIVGIIIRGYLNLRTARFIHLRIEKEIIASVENEIFDKVPFIIKIKNWWNERKKKKEDKLLGG